MADDVTDEIRRRVDIVDLVGQRVSLKKAGKDFKGLCPFHADKNPSFHVSPTLGRYRCWSCQESGDIFTWVMKTQNVEFREALEHLAGIAGVVLPKRGHRSPSQREAHDAAMRDALDFFRQSVAKHPEAMQYCERRGLDAAVRDAWEIGFAPDEGSALATHLRKRGHSLAECRTLFLVDEDRTGGFFDKFRGRLMFPIRDEKGDLVAFGGRLLGEGHPKYINSGDTPLYRKSRVLYGMHRAKDTLSKDRRAVLCEGYLDVIACHRAGVTGALASLGTALAEDQAKLLKRWCDGVVVLYDSDAAGQKAAERAAEVLQSEGLKVRIALMPEGDDPDTLLTRDGAEAVQRATRSGLKPSEYQLELLIRRVGYENDEFWPAAMQIAGAAPTEREMDNIIMRIAKHDPTIKDEVAATRRLRADALTVRRSRAREALRGRAAVSSAPKVPLTSAERIVFRAYLSEVGRDQVAAILEEHDLFETRTAASVAHALAAAFPNPPVGPPSAWLYALPDIESQTLVDLDMGGAEEPITEVLLMDAIASLRSRRERRDLRNMRAGEPDDAQKAQYMERMKQLKGEPNTKV